MSSSDSSIGPTTTDRSDASIDTARRRGSSVVRAAATVTCCNGPTVILRVLLSVLVATLVLAFVFAWYRRKMADMRGGTAIRALPGARLTAERLRRLSTPPWRIVHEVDGRHLGRIDHVVIGPTGVIAIETLMMDRPAVDEHRSDDPHLVAAAAIERGDVDDLTRTVGVPCDLLAKVYWGVAQPDLAAGIEIVAGQVAVDGHRLLDWLVALPPGPLHAAQVDQVWQVVTTGIGRPDPLA